MKPTAVTFILLRPQGDMLMQLRDDGNGTQILYPDTWCFPGGGIERDEKALETLIREVKEEYSLDVTETQCEVLTVYDHDADSDDHVFVCRVSADTVPQLHEGKYMQWMTLEKIKELELAWHQKEFLPKLETYISSQKK